MIAIALAVLRPVLLKSCGLRLDDLLIDLKPARRTTWPTPTTLRRS